MNIPRSRSLYRLPRHPQFLAGRLISLDKWVCPRIHITKGQRLPDFGNKLPFRLERACRTWSAVVGMMGTPTIYWPIRARNYEQKKTSVLQPLWSLYFATLFLSTRFKITFCFRDQRIVLSFGQEWYHRLFTQEFKFVFLLPSREIHLNFGQFRVVLVAYFTISVADWLRIVFTVVVHLSKYFALWVSHLYICTSRFGHYILHRISVNSV